MSIDSFIKIAQLNINTGHREDIWGMRELKFILYGILFIGVLGISDQNYHLIWLKDR